MYTNQIRMTGLSGIDTESMVKQLMKAESIKYDRLYQQRQLLAWKQTAYQSVSTSLLTFQDSFLSYSKNTTNNIRSIANFKGFASTVKVAGAESSAITVKTTSTTVGGDYSLKVLSVAKTDTYKSESKIVSSLTGANSIDINSLTGDTDIRKGDSIKISLDGATSKEIVFDDTFFNSDGKTDAVKFEQALNSKLAQTFGYDSGVQKITAGISDGKLVINAGVGHIATISAGKREGIFKMTADADYVVPTSDITGASFNVTIGGVTKTVNVGDVAEGTTAKNLVNQINKAITAAFKDTGVSGVSVSLSGDKFVISNSSGDNKVTIDDDGGFLESLGFSAATLSQTLDNTSSLTALGVKSGQSTALDTSKDIFELFLDAVDTDGNISFTINGKPFTYKPYDPIDPDSKKTTLKQLMADINSANIGVKISFNSTRSEFTLESTGTGQANAIKLDADFADGFLGKAFGFKDDSALGENAKSHVSVASDAIVELNGLQTSRETNNFTLDGLNITLTPGAEGKTFDISLKKDTTETMALIKNFVADYNKLIESINKQVKTARPKSGNYSYYEPLTKDEKAALSDKEIEDWEKEAKTGMLYRDETLNSMLSQLRTALYQSVEMEDGTKLSLFQLGITTSSKVSEAGMLQIDEAKLQKALDEMPEKVATFFTKASDITTLDKKNRNQRLATEGLGDRINDIINWTAASGGTLYEKAGQAGVTIDTEMSKKLKEQDDKISEMLTYLARRETYYYNMFSKLEAAMNESNSQMASLQSMLGL